MELLDSSMGKIADRVYNELHSTIPEEILGKMSVAVSVNRIFKDGIVIIHISLCVFCL